LIATALLALFMWSGACFAAQSQSTQPAGGCSIQGTASDPRDQAIVNASVHLEATDTQSAVGMQSRDTKTDNNGKFEFDSLPPGNYSISIEKLPLHARASVSLSAAGDVKQLTLVLTDKPDNQVRPDSAGIEFSDQPNFTVAGVTDWTAVGGHGSDLILRTSEDLARDNLTLKPPASLGGPGNSKQAAEADRHRVAAELAEKSGDPLTAVSQFQQATQLDPSEQNYFEWGSELLLHRAVWQAVEILQKGSEAYPQSARMEAALGTALFSGARYDEAAQKLCNASDLDPANAEPYIFMGKIEIASPNPLPCVEVRLARFAREQPDNSTANYLYAIALQKSRDPQSSQRAEAAFTKATILDPKCADAYLQLGIIYADRHAYEQAIRFYLKAIAANPVLADAHYRLAVAYDRSNQPQQASKEFKLHDQIEKQQSIQTEQQRREVKQFQVLLKNQKESTPQ
jgi:tetratricopeptide (TPR) repeat protein